MKEHRDPGQRLECLVVELYQENDGETNVDGFQMGLDLTWVGITSCEWISSISGLTRADGTMIVDIASCISAARSWTRIDTFLVDTCPIQRTLGTGDTFRSTSRWRSDISGQT